MEKQSMFNLNGKVVVITGGAGLIGREFVKSVSNFNGTAVIADIDPERGNALQKVVPNATYVSLDITDDATILAAIQELHGKFGRIDSLVNNAYPPKRKAGTKFFEVRSKDFALNISSHLGGYFLASQKFSEYFCKQGHGNIINIASIYGVSPPDFDIYEGTGMTLTVEYSMTKSALVHLTKYMAKFFKGKNIRVNSISPGGVLDNQDEAFLEKYKKKCLNKGMLDKGDFSGALIYLLSDSSSAMNGQNMIVDDGFTL
jgi:NAD(P)-dependent dehydrogenase (short-subunit alcohol dehydrogenase family)